ncbi:putative signal transduction family protein (GGDEF domain protein) [Desulforapulum autotrophicum HRM2]|uniref:diguanylate cyclase n=1 Tax=Desulforapulum autotrophicum (strain ATCC 43914 / DSM 3382 / VKM B-1955 / HRM2) TaxID=177437 RepID=C0QAB8_DESAH|nr:diguanylate cyclase [Desulforapulum autotrophicum]ACN14703.1 putative signal transduction family protein (GGDEF domain protein) [Desulforapulum autotrophicum HRM2]
MNDRESIGIIDKYIGENVHGVTPVPFKDIPETCHLLEGEINTFNFRNLFNTASQIFGSLTLAEKYLLDGLKLDNYYIRSRSTEDRVEPLHLVHLLQDDFWISNYLSSCILENAERHLRGSILGEDPLFEAGKRLRATNGILASTVMRMITIEQLMYISRMRNNSYNHIKKIFPSVDRKGRCITLRIEYKTDCTRASNGLMTNKAVCNWYRGALFGHMEAMGLQESDIQETQCVTQGHDCCVFECRYIPKPFFSGLRHHLINLIDGSLAHKIELLVKNQRELSLTIADLRKKDRETNLQLKALLIEIGQKNLQLEALTLIDYLTGLYNRKYYTERLKETLRICNREKRILAVVMMDIDHFKSVNDKHGHAAGDECLRMIGQVLKTALKKTRPGDFAARYGGEEFVLIFSGANADWVEKKANEIRKTIQAQTVNTMNNREEKIEISITISMGFACKGPIFDDEIMLSPEIMTRRADTMLYKAKQLGRNRVVGESQ